MIPNNVDLIWLAINAYHEARGESQDGQKAVCHVVMNRINAKHPTAESVILQPFQFSWANGHNRPAITDYDSLVGCYQIAKTCLAERELGEKFHGADHYFADTISKPAWAKNMTEVSKIGRHTFYRA